MAIVHLECVVVHRFQSFGVRRSSVVGGEDRIHFAMRAKSCHVLVGPLGDLLRCEGCATGEARAVIAVKDFEAVEAGGPVNYCGVDCDKCCGHDVVSRIRNVSQLKKRRNSK